MFSVGDKIVYPMHGAGVIQKIEDKKILGEKRPYYILKLPCNDMNVMIPVDAETTVGIRNIVDKRVMEEVVALLCTESTKMDGNWNRRYRENMEKLKSGDIMQVAEVVRNLVRVNRAKPLSSGERKLLTNAKQILSSEMILVLDIGPAEAEALIEESV